MNFLLFSILFGGFLSDEINFHPARNYLEEFASDDIQFIYFPLKLTKLYNFIIF